MKKIDFRPFIILLGFIGWAFTGYEIRQLSEKPIVEEKTVVIKEMTDYEDSFWIEKAIKDISEKYQIDERVFKAIIKCEGGSPFAISPTNDYGLYQINIKTAKRYGVNSLKGLIDPFEATELAAKILQKEQLKPWKNQDCIIKELLKIQKTK